jgi:GT2 family glycosyltransferase
MHRPSVTTIIPTYRRPQLLRRAISSALSQTYPDLEVLVCDNASGDETPAIVSSIARQEPRVKYYCQRENIGIVRNFNFGLSQVETPYFSFLGDDDTLLPDFYETATQSLQSHRSALLFAGLTNEIYEGSNTASQAKDTTRQGFYPNSEGFFAIFEREATPRLCTGMLFRRELIGSVGFLDEELISQHDHDFVIRAALRGSIVLSDLQCAQFHHHHESIHVNTPMVQWWQGWIQILRKTQSDAELPTRLRARAAAVIKRKLVEDITRSALRSSRQGKFDQVSEAISTLKDGVGISSRADLVAAITADTPLGRGMRGIVSLASRLSAALSRRESINN